jgi:hypothetical protein
MSNKLKRPYRFTPKEDELILNLFDWVSTEKLSQLMKVSADKIIWRYQHLNRGGK